MLLSYQQIETPSISCFKIINFTYSEFQRKCETNIVQNTKAMYTQKLPIRQCYYMMRGLISDPYNEYYHTYAYNLHLIKLHCESHFCF